MKITDFELEQLHAWEKAAKNNSLEMWLVTSLVQVKCGIDPAQSILYAAKIVLSKNDEFGISNLINLASTKMDCDIKKNFEEKYPDGVGL